MIGAIEDLVALIGLTGEAAFYTAKGILVAVTVLLSFIANFIAKRIIVVLIGKAVRKTKTTWDEAVFDRGVLSRLSHLAPALVIYFMGNLIFPENPAVTDVIQRLAIAYMIGVSILVIDSFLSAVNDIYSTFSIAKSRPIKGYLQVVKIITYIVGLVLIITRIMNTSALGILSGFGAMSAVLLLVFKDSILGFVASIQLSANNMVHIGDWVEMSKYGADGEVIEINLQTIKVQNWDKTITTIPVYALVSDSFRNWRGMMESGGRRIKRSVNIDIRSIGFCTDEMIEKFKKIDYLKGYIEKKLQEIDEYNRNSNIDISDMINGRRLTNIGTFRVYITEYLKNHPQISNTMTFLVRQLQPGPQGLPIEVYVFSTDQRWAYYESIQADIFDHILAIIPEFGLKVYQEPSGWDMHALADSVKNGLSKLAPK
jgi:miniconductance mechanosensitive channel